MDRLVSFLVLICLASPSIAQSITVTHPIRAGDTLTAENLRYGEIEAEAGFIDARDLIGLEARVNLYPGRPVLAYEVGNPTVIARNQIVDLVFEKGGLSIRLEGRALSRAGDGDAVRVMNLDSRSTVVGIATSNGTVIVQ